MAASAAVGRERENPRSERSEPAALKVQLCEGGGIKILDDSKDWRFRATAKRANDLKGYAFVFD